MRGVRVHAAQQHQMSDLGPSLALATDGGHGHVLLQISIPRATTDGQGEGEGRRQRSRRAAAGRRRVGGPDRATLPRMEALLAGCMKSSN